MLFRIEITEKAPLSRKTIEMAMQRGREALRRQFGFIVCSPDAVGIGQGRIPGIDRSLQ